MSLIWNDIQAGQPADPTPINNLAHYVTQSLVEKEEGKGLSTADYTAEEKGKLAGIQAGAQVNPEIVSDFSGGTGKVASAEETKALKELIDEIPSGINGTHQSEKIATEEGVHGFRYYSGNIQVNVDSAWVTIETNGGGGTGFPPADVSNIEIKPRNNQLIISWTDPEDVYLEGEIPLIIWGGTKVVRKIGSYPNGPDDGTLVVNSTERNAFAVSGYADTGLINGITYYYGLFPYSNTGSVNINEDNRISGIPVDYKVFGVQIDLTNDNPETSVTYTDDAVGKVPGSSWDTEAIFKDIKPCVLKNGAVQYYLNPLDLTKKEDGTASNITSGTDGDVMIEIPRVGFSIVTVGDTIMVRITNNPESEEVNYYAHTRLVEGDREKLYIGAYLGHSTGGKLRSLSGKTVTGNQTISSFRTLAQANGTGYDLVSFYPLMLLLCLYLIKYKSLDSQTAIGEGYVKVYSSRAPTGGTNTLGIDYGETSGTQQMCFLNIEDMWGNLLWLIDGFYSDGSRNIFTAFSGFNDAASNYTNRGQGASSDIGGYMSRPHGTTETGFIIKETNGSETTYFADAGYLFASAVAQYGGSASNGLSAGIFCFQALISITYADPVLGARLMYL